MILASASEIRRALKQVMPAEAFDRQPQRGVAAILAFVATGGAAVIIVCADLPLVIELILSVGIGEGIASVGLAAHESEHGAVFESAWARKLLAWIGFGPLLVTPGLWTAWHVRAHHRGANQSKWDPDILAGVEQDEGSWISRQRSKFMPGSRHLFSYLAYFTLFTIEGQYFLWVASARQPLAGRIRINRVALGLSSVLLIGSWIALGVSLGLRDALLVLVLPLAVANFVLMAYISTQHWIRPRVETDDPFATTLSVAVPRWMDRLHFGFSYHQEHHIFPSMSARFAPLLREKLREIAPEAIALMPIGAALRAVMTTPVLYVDDRKLSRAGGNEAVDLDELAVALELPTRIG